MNILNTPLGITKPIRITTETLCMMAFILYFAQDAIRVLVATAFSFLSADVVTWIMIVVMYMPLVLALILDFQRMRRLVATFLLLLLMVAAFFEITYLIHPEYASWYFEGSYPVLRWIFKPNRFLYASLFVLIMPSPKATIKALKIVGLLLLVYYTYRLVKAEYLGYWITTTTASGPQNAEYDLSYGYDHLFVFAIFFVCGMQEKKPLYFVLAGISIIEIILGGSRGPLLYIAVMAILLFLRYRKTINIKIRALMTLLIVLLAGICLVLGIEGSVVLLGTILSKVLGTSSRTVQTLLGGTSSALDSSGRDQLYAIALNMIKNGFWGYGAYGDRYVIGQTFWVGYSHNLFLEILIDFGWIVGGILCIRIVVNSIKMLFFCKEDDWYVLFTVFFIGSMKLLSSGSFWFSEPFWGAIAVYYLYRREKKYSQKLTKGDQLELTAIK